MALPFATETNRYSHLVKYELEPSVNWCSEFVTVNEATAKTYTVGTALGLVTATGKYKVSVQTAVDGSQNPVAVVTDDYTVAAATDTKVRAFVRGPAILSKAAVLLDATFNDATKVAAAYASLAGKNILVNDAA